jgi:hypothetical protein
MNCLEVEIVTISNGIPTAKWVLQSSFGLCGIGPGNAALRLAVWACKPVVEINVVLRKTPSVNEDLWLVKKSISDGRRPRSCVRCADLSELSLDLRKVSGNPRQRMRSFPDPAEHNASNFRAVVDFLAVRAPKSHKDQQGSASAQ